VLHGPRQAHAHSGDVIHGASCLGQEQQAFAHHAVQHGFRPVRHILRQALLGEDLAVKVRDGDDHVRGPHIHCQHHTDGGVEGKARRRPSAA
jgi:hypothetical protein